MTHRIRSHGPGLNKHLHRGLKVLLVGVTAQSQRDVAKGAENGRLGTAVQDCALKVGEEDLHETLGVLGCGWAKRTADVTDETDGDATELILLMSLQSVDEERQEGAEVRVEVSLKGCRKNVASAVQLEKIGAPRTYS